MKNKKPNKLSIFKILGFIFILIYLLLLFYKVPKSGFESVIWFCDFIMLFSGIILILNRRKMLSVYLVQSMIVQFPWFIDAISLLLFNTSPLGVSSYIFEPSYPLFDFILSMRHLLVVPVLLLYFLKNKFYDKLSFHSIVNILTFILLIGLSLLVSNPIANTNCAYKHCVKIFPNFEPLFIHLISFLIMLMLLQLALIKPIRSIIIFLKENERKSKFYIILISVAMLIGIIAKYVK